VAALDGTGPGPSPYDAAAPRLTARQDPTAARRCLRTNGTFDADAGNPAASPVALH
jgi:hypothetical protein